MFLWWIDAGNYFLNAWVLSQFKTALVQFLSHHEKVSLNPTTIWKSAKHVYGQQMSECRWIFAYRMGWGSVGPRWSAFSAAAACSRRDTKFRKKGDLNIMIRITINLIDLFSTMGFFSRKNIIHRIIKCLKCSIYSLSFSLIEVVTHFIL